MFAEMNINSSVIGWAVIASFIVLNYGRVALHIQIYDCHTPKYDDHHRFLASTDDAHAPSPAYLQCAYKRSLIFFAIVGLLLMFCAVILAIFARIYILRVMASRGVSNVFDYATFLQLLESTENSHLEANKLNRNQIKVCIAIVCIGS